MKQDENKILSDDKSNFINFYFIVSFTKGTETIALV